MSSRSSIGGGMVKEERSKGGKEINMAKCKIAQFLRNCKPLSTRWSKFWDALISMAEFW
ncbi:hypothetical protein CR513_38656 [Mucuna pruriens]|uniref:Uncharacterized protein n=1 Tax=Mucuna pruriens TaxID=157652 RepID=A0A371FR41_MUCPR|nr:hypothetical protein CR513_38656 [Mucuna pruriens]